MNRHDTSDDDKVSAPYTRALQQSAQAIDKPTQRALDNARNAALDSVTEPRRFSWPAPWIASGMVAATLVAAVVVLTPDRAAMPFPEDLELLTTDTELEMYENLEFALWLDKDPLHNDG